MSRFYGTLVGQAKTMATRRGGPKDGVVTHAASWYGAVRVRVFAHKNNGADEDWVEIGFVPWQGCGGIGKDAMTIYRGRINPTIDEYSKTIWKP